MKLNLEVFDLGETLFCIQDNKVKTFTPGALNIRSDYQGYSGDNWGDTACGKGGFPFKIEYCDDGNPKQNSIWMPHSKLFRSKEELIESL